ncbi:hypothetical protein, partial [Phytohabitans rumicis]|uniref:hypothetical protein n=1 Tax=Phytohabitans rumicis TaxID=1076125 RepID=UPI0031EDEF46
MGLFEQAVADYQGDLCLEVQWGVEWFVVEHLLDERGDQHVLVVRGHGWPALRPGQDVLADAGGEVAVDSAGGGQHVGQHVIAVFDHVVGVGTGHLLHPGRSA